MDRAGVTGPTKRQAAGPRWRQTTQGLYVPVGTDSEVVEQRILEQAMRLPEGGAVTGWAACRLWGSAFCDGLERDGVTCVPVPLLIGRRGNIRGDVRVRLLYEPLENEVGTRFGIPCVSVERAAVDAMRLAADYREATVVLDMLAAAECTSPRRVAAALERYVGMRRIGQARRAVGLPSEHSRSPNETRLRLVWVLDAGVRVPAVNCPVFDRAGHLLGTADLLDLEAGLAVEFDGAEHRSAKRQTRDAAKDEAFRRVGLEVTRVTGRDLLDTPLVVGRLRSARSRARFEGAHQRAWVPRPRSTPSTLGWRTGRPWPVCTSSWTWRRPHSRAAG